MTEGPSAERAGADDEPAAVVPASARAAQSALRASERPLKAFLSSVMRGGLNGARQIVVDTLDATPFLSAWAFEFTPPSPEPADDTYLRHVRDADFVIWLAGAEVSRPVTNEIREALAFDRQLIIVRYGTEARTAACQALLDEVGLAAKYADARDEGDLARAIELAMGDQIVRALRGEPSLGRLARIEELGRASRSRCVVRWRAAGLPRELAADLASRTDVGAPPPETLPTSEKPVVLLVGELGAGKSTCAERQHQAAIAALLSGESGVLPVWLRAAEAAGDLRRAVGEACTDLGRPSVQGAAVVVDGLDEAGVDVAAGLVMEARELAADWSNTKVLLTSRPRSYVGLSEERTDMPELRDADAWSLAAVAAGEPIREAVLRSLPHAVKESARRPLFALLVGLWHRDAGTAGPRSRADLLAFLGERALERAGASASVALSRLAVEAVRNELRPLPAHTIGRATEVRSLRESGLVTEIDGGIAFGLPVLAQWFAAQALLEGQLDTSALCGEPQNIDLWLEPIAIAVATGTYEDSVRLLSPIADEIPGFVFRILDTSLARLRPGGSAGPWRVAGERIRETLSALVGAVLPLGAEVLPVDDEQRVLPMAIASDGQHVMTAYYDARVLVDPGEPRPELFPLPDDFGFLDAGWEWRGVRGALAGPEAVWPWRWAHDVIKHALGEQIKHRRLPLVDGPLATEEEWEAVVDFTQTTPSRADRIAIAPILQELEERLTETEREAARLGVPVRSSTFSVVGGRDHDQYWLRDRLRAACARGLTHLTGPLPTPDRLDDSGGFIDRAYSDQRLVAYATILYEAAIEAYDVLVDAQLPLLSSRMALATTFPAEFVATIFRGDGRAFETTSLSGYFVPRPIGHPSSVSITVDGSYRHPDRRAREAYERLKVLRPDTARWITAWAGGSWFNPGARYPITKAVTAWLWRDLTHAGVVEGMLPADNL